MKADILGDKIVFQPSTGAEERGIKSFLAELVRLDFISQLRMDENFTVNINKVKDLELCLDD